jgi:glycosyltransferase involved in cell wall biosynthesis
MPLRLKKIAFFTVVFPSIEKHLDDFLGSLTEQTSKDFDLYLINDGLEDLERFKAKYAELNIYEIALSGTPSKIREAGIDLVSNKGYETIIFGDADDYFAKNRVEKAVELLERCDIVVNDLNIVDESGALLEKHYLSKRVKPGSVIDPGFIKDKNVLGFSNTAIRRSAFNKVIFNRELIAVDWFFFSYLLNMGSVAVFTDETVTNYRQHRLNMVGIGKYGEGNIIKGLRVKLLQYEEMSKINPEYAQLEEDLKAILKKVENNGGFREFYLTTIKNNAIKYPLWWEEIKTSGDLK